MKTFGITLLVAVCGVATTVFVESVGADEPATACTRCPKCDCAGAGYAACSQSCTRQADLERVGLLPYVVDAPDVLRIKLTHARPKAMLTLRHGDVLQIAATGTEAGQELICRSTVDSSGHVRLGKIVGMFKVGDLTQSQCIEKIEKHLSSLGFFSPTVTVALVGAQGVDGEHVVDPDGNIKLGGFGVVAVGGMTIDEIKQAVEEKLADALDSPRVDVDVAMRNSKVVYVIVQGMEEGDYIVRLPCEPGTTVSELIRSTTLPNPIDLNETKMWISRPTPDGSPRSKVLPIDWKAISSSNDASTNHPLLPGDRVFVIVQKKVAAQFAPVEAKAKEVGYYQPIQKNKMPVAQDATKRDNPGVKLALMVLEDTKGNFAEFEPLKNGHVMFADSATTLGTIRILNKNDLIEIIAAPALVCPSGKRAFISVGEQHPEGIDEQEQSIRVDLLPVINDESAIRVEVRITVKNKDFTTVLDTPVLIDQGRSVILRTRRVTQEGASNADAAPPVYVVLTPELLR